MRHILVLLAALTVPAVRGQTVDYEGWDRAQILVALGGLAVIEETACEFDAVPSSAWAGEHDSIADLHAGLLSPYDGIAFPNYNYVQVEHVVARKEADESGMCLRGDEARTLFAADLLNLTFSPGSLNSSKGDMDAHDLETASMSLFRDALTEHAKCWWAAQTVRVKSKYRLGVDTDERSALASILDACEAEQVFRPKLAAGADWSFRSEYLARLTGEREIPVCSVPVESDTNLRLAVIATTRYLEDFACTVRDPSEEGSAAPEVDNSRETQRSAQTACQRTLEGGGYRTNCGNIRQYCPDVEPIFRGEPMYGSLRDANGNGIVCEDL